MSEQNPIYEYGDALSEVERLRTLMGQIKQEWAMYQNWGQNPLDTLKKIKHLTACGLAPAPNK